MNNSPHAMLTLESCGRFWRSFHRGPRQGQT